MPKRKFAGFDGDAALNVVQHGAYAELLAGIQVYVQLAAWIRVN